MHVWVTDTKMEFKATGNSDSKEQVSNQTSAECDLNDGRSVPE